MTYTISTLGPEGTDSQRAAHHYALSSGISDYDILLCESFEDALDRVRDGSDFGIVPAAYPGLFALHCKYRDLPIIGSFVLYTKSMVLARANQNGPIRTVALHPATKHLLSDQYEPVFINSKPLCLRKVVDGDVDAGIGSKDVAEELGLKIVEEFGEIPMTWEVFSRGEKNGL